MEKKEKRTEGLPIWEDPDLDLDRKADEGFFNDEPVDKEEADKYIKEARGITGGDPCYSYMPEPIGGIGNID